MTSKSINFSSSWSCTCNCLIIYPGTSTRHVSLSHYSLALSRDGRHQIWPKHVLIVVRYVSSLSDVCRHRNNREAANIINFQKISFPCLLICRLEYIKKQENLYYALVRTHLFVYSTAFICIVCIYYCAFQVVAIVSCLFVVVSTLCLIFSTLPAFQVKDHEGKISRKFI